jgi:hypothetical protein
MIVRVILALIVAYTCTLGSALAADGIDPRMWTDPDQYEKDRIIQQAASLEAAKLALEAKPASEWTDADIDEYLNCAFWAVCYGMYCYVGKNHRLPESPVDLAETELLAHWPGNPLRGWQPMRVLAVDDGFSAGDLLLQICPPEYYSGLAQPVARSFEMAIYGRNEDTKPAQDHDPTVGCPWAQFPDGLLALGGMHTEPYTSTRKKWARRKEQQKAEDIQN